MSNHESQEWTQTETASASSAASKETTIMGAPIESRGKTLIPVATAGESSWLNRLTFRKPDNARPMGFLVVTDRKTRFVKVQDRRWLLLGVILAAIALILLLAGFSLKVQKSRPRKPALW
ncbi:MAG: hypothetical protein ACAI44_31970 [Candidatus Sericytochromatia bacterium]